MAQLGIAGVMAWMYWLFLGLCWDNQPRRWVFAILALIGNLCILLVGAVGMRATGEDPAQPGLVSAVAGCGVAASFVVWSLLGMRAASHIGKAVVDMRAQRTRRVASAIGVAWCVGALQLSGILSKSELDVVVHSAGRHPRTGVSMIEILSAVLSASGLAVALVLAFRVLRTRLRQPNILLLRSFKTDRKGLRPDRAIAELCGAVGRFDGLSEPTNEDYELFGIRSFAEDDAWKLGVRRLLRRAKMVVVDVSIRTPGVSWELDAILGVHRRPDQRVLVIASAESADISPPSPELRYRSTNDLVFIQALTDRLQAWFPERKAALSRALNEISRQVVPANNPGASP